MQRLTWVGRALFAVGVGSYVASVWAQQSWWTDWFKGPAVATDVSAEPGVPWQPRQPLPPIAAPTTAPAPNEAAPITLAELTEFALRNNPRARQAWFAA